MDFNPRSREGSDQEGIISTTKILISIHAPARGATRQYGIDGFSLEFQSTLPRGERLESDHEVFNLFYFNPRSREGSDFMLLATMVRLFDFNPRSREGSDNMDEGSFEDFLQFQSTLPRGERHIASFQQPMATHISIHAPARGATTSDTDVLKSGYISIHAPARGATHTGGSVPHFTRDFNPRSREGSDEPAFRFMYFSINFNPRSREGSDVDEGYDFTLIAISIHAPARGATSLVRKEALLGQNFNPRSREGSDPMAPRTNPLRMISIHAPARGATAILSKIHPMFLTISHNASSFSSFPFHSFLPHLLNSSTFCALFQVRISRGFSVYYRFAPKKSTPDLQLYHVLHRYVQL